MESRLQQGISTNENNHLQGDHPRLSGFLKKFTIHTDASDVQLGAVIMQAGKPLDFYSKKVSKSKINYTMTEKELLNIVENLKELQNILLGNKIEVFTGHKNLTYEMIDIAYQRIYQWKSLIKEFGVTLIYIKGGANIVANDFSWLPMVHHAHKLADTTLE